ncbi:MAG: hypothetical protein ACR5LA_10165 [Wolbachia sp.]
MTLKKLQDITEELNKSIQNRSIVKSPVYVNNLVENIQESLDLVKNDHSQNEEIIRKLWYIYQLLTTECAIIQENCWDNFRHSSANNEPLSDKYSIEVAYKNLNIVVEALKLLVGDNENRKETLNQAMSLQKKMKEALEKMQQQQNAARQKEELEKKSKEEFSKYIENGTIDGVLIQRYQNSDLLHATIKLQDNNTSIKISEFLNSKFCTENNIAGFSLNDNQEKGISGYVDNKVRHYNLSAIGQYGVQFDWYVDRKKCSITLSANSDGSIKIVGDKPADEDLEKNKDVRIKVNGKYSSLADAVVSSKFSQPDAVVNSKLSQPVALPQERIAPLRA